MSVSVRSSRWLKALPAICWMALIFYLSSRQTIPSPPGISYDFGAVIGHFLIYATLTLAYLFAIEDHLESSRKTLIIAVIGAVAFALSDEYHQSFVPGRMPSVFDIAVDSIGSISAAIVWRLAILDSIRKIRSRW